MAPQSDRVSFIEHDLFQEQSLQADTYLYRSIFHNWSDAEVKRIIAALSSALQDGTRLMIMDVVVPPANTMPMNVEKETRLRDFQMFALLAGKERSLDEFQGLVGSVGLPFKFEGIYCPDGSFMNLMTWVYRKGS
jgi:6-hydroxytryprostatin B O-methyltransferase